MNIRSELDQIQRILILRMGPLGETLLTTPVIRALRKRFPEAHIAYMVAPTREELVSANPNLDEVISYEKSVPKLIYGMAKRSFQMAVVLQPTFRLVLHTFLARIPFRVGFETNSGRKRLLHVAVPNNPAQHETARYLDVVRGLGIEPDTDEPEMFVDEAARKWADVFLVNAGVSPDRPLIGLNPGAGSTYRRWSKMGFAKVGDWLHRKYGAQILITAGGWEKTLPHKVANLMSSKPIIVTGTTPMQLGAVIQKCNLFISNDTGPMHMSVAVKTPTVALFGASNPLQWGPIWPQHTLIARKSMKDITVEDVLTAAENRLEEKMGKLVNSK
ncbi:MAG: glycosyltransferase family 9 protein [Candidatus Poribacteria bacterium]|nr:glycosyltransferase family 9 protein [Candidatus Poribacteria bacterium]